MILRMANTGSASRDPIHRYQSLIQSRLNQLSTAEQAVAAHLAAHPAELPFETAESIAKRLGISAMTVGRTLKALGYRGLGELRAEMRSEVPDAVAAPWLRRGATQPVVKNVDRARALRAEIEAIEAVHALAETRRGAMSSARLQARTAYSSPGFRPSADWRWPSPTSSPTFVPTSGCCRSPTAPLQTCAPKRARRVA